MTRLPLFRAMRAILRREHAVGSEPPVAANPAPPVPEDPMSVATRTTSGVEWPRHSDAWQTVMVLLLQAVLIVGVVHLSLGSRRDPHVPITLSNDSLVFLAQSKGTLDNGWWWINPALGAPFVFDARLFPSNTNVDQAIVRAVSLFTRDPALAVTAAWIAMLVAAAWGATFCFRLLGLSRHAAFVAGVLFALSPYALYRQIDHFSLVTYLVPYPATLALVLAAGRRLDPSPVRTFPLLGGIALVGFNYVYYAFFSCFFILFATIAGWWRTREVQLLRTGAAALVGIGLCVGLNFLPTVLAVRKEGPPILVGEKVPAEAEIYGLKIRQLVSPVFEHQFKLFRMWTGREASASFPIETENMISRLGAVASMGFLGLLILLLLSRATDGPGVPNLPAARLTVAGLLLATVGGFGSLFNLLVLPEIRAYNRIAPFLAFFALLAVASVIDAVSRWRSRWGWGLAVVTLVIGVWDQSQALGPLRRASPRIATEYRAISRFVLGLESAVPPGSAVLQLPFRHYLNDEGLGRMGPYEHLRPYLASRSLRWSYPAISNAQLRWQEAAAKLDPTSLVSLAIAEGFTAIWIDRYGYSDGGLAVLTQLLTVPGNWLILQDERYAAVGLGGHTPLHLPHGQSLEDFLQDRPVSAGLRPCGKAPEMSLDRIGGGRVGPGSGPVVIPRARALAVGGWAVTPGTHEAGTDVEIKIDETLFPTFYGFERSDVSTYFHSEVAKPSGLRAVIPSSALAEGAHALTLRLLSRDEDCYFESPAIRLEVR